MTAQGEHQLSRRMVGRRGRPLLLRERATKPRRRFRAGRLLATLHRLSEVMQAVLEPEIAAWSALSALTAGEGFGFNRAFLLLAERDELRGWFGVGPSNREEAAWLWADLRRQGVKPIERLGEPDMAVIAREKEKHAAVLARLSHAVEPGCGAWQRPFVGRAGHPHPCVHHWVEVLESPALAVIPIMAANRPWGVILADNFVTGAAVYPGTLEAASTLANALRVTLDRTHLLRRLQEEERLRLAAEHATTLLEAAQTLAHDLKNPLAVAGGLARELVEKPPTEWPAIHRHLATVAGAVKVAEERLTQLVDRLGTGASGVNLTEVEVGALAERVVNGFRPLAAGRQIHLLCSRPGRDVRARAEPSFLERCIENLIGNALQALREQLEVGIVRVVVLAGDNQVRVEVVDNGPPLPVELRVDPFSGGISTHRSGTGLGLVSVRRLMHAMGGRVEYDEREAGWVRFTLFLRRWS